MKKNKQILILILKTLFISFHLQSLGELHTMYSDYLVRRNYSEKHSSTMYMRTFDAVWSAAIALNNTINALPANTTLEDFHYGDAEFGQFIYDQLTKVKFRGMTVGIVCSAKTQDSICFIVN